MLSIGVLGPCRFSRKLRYRGAWQASLQRGAPERLYGALLPEHKKSDLANENSLKDITVVSGAREAMLAVTKLIQLGPRRHVAWSHKFSQSDADDNARTRKFLTLSAYAGENIDFGNGPHLCIRTAVHCDQEKVYNVLKNYFEDDYCRKVWFDYISAERLLAVHGIRPAGLAADLVSMGTLTTNSACGGGGTVGKMASTVLADQEMRKAASVTTLNRKFLHKDACSSQWDWKYSRMEAESILSSCADAALTYIVFEKLNEQLQTMNINGMNSTSDFQREFGNLREVHDFFFLPLMNCLYEMHRRGLKVNTDMLEGEERNSQDKKRALEQQFLKWACEFSPDAAVMDIGSQKQLQQLLFAPCTNIHVKTKALPEEARFVQKRKRTGKELRASKFNGNSREIPITPVKEEYFLRGRGAKAHVYTAAGWPSVSETALRKAAGFPRARKPTFGQKDHAFCYAVDDLLKSRSIKRRKGIVAASSVSKHAIDEDGRLRILYRIDSKSGRVHPEIEEKELTSIRRSIIAGPGNTLLVGRLIDMELSMLGHLSGCDALRERLEEGADKYELSTVALFENVKDAVQEGRCKFNGSTHHVCTHRGVPTIADAFPLEWTQSKLMDRAIARGGSRQEARKLLGLKSQGTRKLLKCWYDAHPGVLEWRERTLEYAKQEGFIETVSGRRRVTKNLNSETKSVRDAACAAAIGFVMQGSCGEAIMGALVNLAEEEVLTNLGWRVVFAHENCIILEGPQYAAEVARPVVERILREPLDFELDVMFEVAVAEGISVADVEERLSIKREGKGSLLF